MVIYWLYNGYIMVIEWLYTGYIMVLYWLYNGLYNGFILVISADPCLALAQAGRRPGSPQVCGFGLLGPRPARPTRHQTL